MRPYSPKLQIVEGAFLAGFRRKRTLLMASLTTTIRNHAHEGHDESRGCRDKAGGGGDRKVAEVKVTMVTAAVEAISCHTVRRRATHTSRGGDTDSDVACPGTYQPDP